MDKNPDPRATDNGQRTTDIAQRTSDIDQRTTNNELRTTILFDGDCAFCNGWVKWITKRDKRGRFNFLPLGSEEGKVLRRLHHVPDHIDSVVLVEGGAAYTRSGASWRILRRLPGWGLISFLLRIVPRPLRDLGYDLVARNRHRLGMKDDCELPQ